MSRSTTTSEPCLPLDLPQTELSRMWPTPHASCSTGAGTQGRDGGLNLQTAVALMSSAAASPARTSASPARAQGWQASEAAYGASTPDSFANYDPATSSWRTSQRCLVEGWATYSETWPRSGTTRNGTAFQLPPLALRTNATGYGLWPTPTTDSASNRSSRYAQGGMPLAAAVKLWPTPTAMGDKCVGRMDEWGGSRSREKLRSMVPESELRGALNPTWVEWLMGYPLGWTDCEPSATPSSRRSPRSSDEPSSPST